MEWNELLMTALRAFGIYALMLVVIRLLGKRTVGNFSAFDLLVALMLGEVVDEAIYGDVDFIQATVAILVIAAARYGTAWLSFSSPKLSKLLEGKPVPIVKNGRLQRKGMRNELMSELDVHAALRLKEISDLGEVKLAVVESDGEVSVLRQEWAEQAEKQDVLSKEKLKAEKEQESDGRTRTDSPRALGAA